MKKFLTLTLSIGALFAVALAIPAAATSSPDQSGPMADDAGPEPYSCEAKASAIPKDYRGAFAKACAAAKKEGIKPVKKMMSKMKKALKGKCKPKAPEGKKFKIGCKPCHGGKGKAGNTKAAGIKLVLDCDASLLVDK